MITIQHCKECLSKAYITAVVGRARLKLNWTDHPDYGVDGHVRAVAIRGERHLETAFGFAFQSKSTTDWTREGDVVVYDLEAKTYNDLVQWSAETAMPLILILLCLPSDDSTWINASDERLILQRSAYWTKITGSPTTNGTSVRLRIPAANLLTPSAVQSLVDTIKTGGTIP